jgi:hypothetical protein
MEPRLSAERCFIGKGARVRPDMLALSTTVGDPAIAASFLDLDRLTIRHLAVGTLRSGQAVDLLA